MRKWIAAGALALACLVGTAEATVIVLNFEGVNLGYPSGHAPILGFYNGGVSGDGQTGVNYGVEFTDNALAICLNTLVGRCSNTSRGGVGDPTSDKGALFFLEGSQTYMNVAAGFDTGFAFNYTAINSGGSVSVYDGLNGTGTLLATLVLPTTPSGPCEGYSAGFCPFFAAGVGFAGIGKSISFAGVANQIVFDDVTFGSVTPGQVPEPTSLALLGAGLLGVARARRRR